MTRVVTITSGKGGVGKTVMSVNMALHFAALGYRTCLFDADLGLANVNIVLGLNPQYTLADVITKNHSLHDIIIRDYEGLDIIPGGSGVAKLADLHEVQANDLIRTFCQLDGYDFLLFDTAAGISRNVISFCLACSEVVVIITPEPTSVTDSYALLKVLTLNGFKGAVKMIVNHCKSEANGREVFSRFNQAVKKYLQLDIVPLGNITIDEKVAEAVGRQRPLLSLYPDSPASISIKAIAYCLLQNQPDDSEIPSVVSFWKSCLNIFNSPLNLTNPKKLRTKTERTRNIGHGELHLPNSNREISLLLSKLVHNVSLVPRELKLLRKAILGEPRITNNSNASGIIEEQKQPSRLINLDLEAYLQDRLGEEQDA